MYHYDYRTTNTCSQLISLDHAGGCVLFERKETVEKFMND